MSESEPELEHVRGYLPMWVGPPRDLARLQVSKSGRLVAYLDFNKRSFISLGRSPDKVTYCLDHPSISRIHALFVHHPRLHSYFLIDCASAHGTFVGGKRIEPKVPVRISDGTGSSEHITFGGSSRVYVLQCLSAEQAASRRAAGLLSAEEDPAPTHPAPIPSPGGSSIPSPVPQPETERAGRAPIPSPTAASEEGRSEEGPRQREGGGRGARSLLERSIPVDGCSPPSSLATASSLSRLALTVMDHLSDDGTTAETASNVSVDDVQSTCSTDLDAVSLMSSASAGSLADLDVASNREALCESYETRVRRGLLTGIEPRSKKRKRVSWNDDVTEIPPLNEGDWGPRYEHLMSSTIVQRLRDRDTPQHRGPSRRRSQSGGVADTTRRNMHSLFTRSSRASRLAASLALQSHREAQAAAQEKIEASEAAGGEGKAGVGVAGAAVALTAQPYQGLPAAASEVEAGGDRAGWQCLSESEESAHTEEAASEAASEAGESTDASTGFSVTEEPAEAEVEVEVEVADKDSKRIASKSPPRDHMRGRPRMRLPSPPPPTPAELEARWGSRGDSGSDGESLVDDRDRRAKSPGLPAAAKKLLSQ